MHSSRMRTVSPATHNPPPPPTYAPVPAMHLSPPADRLTDTCENIIFPQLVLRMVMSYILFTSIGRQSIHKTRMHSSRMRTTRALLYGVGGGVSVTDTARHPADRDNPRQRPPWGSDRDPPETHPWTETHYPMNRITDRCKNITFPQLLLRAVIICKTSLKNYPLCTQNRNI